jgi:hypothetical protein
VREGGAELFRCGFATGAGFGAVSCTGRSDHPCYDLDILLAIPGSSL